MQARDLGHDRAFTNNGFSALEYRDHLTAIRIRNYQYCALMKNSETFLKQSKIAHSFFGS